MLFHNPRTNLLDSLEVGAEQVLQRNQRSAVVVSHPLHAPLASEGVELYVRSEGRHAWFRVAGVGLLRVICVWGLEKCEWIHFGKRSDDGRSSLFDCLRWAQWTWGKGGAEKGW